MKYPIKLEFSANEIKKISDNFSIKFLWASTAHLDNNEVIDSANFECIFDNQREEIVIENVNWKSNIINLGDYFLELKYAYWYSQTCELIITKKSDSIIERQSNIFSWIIHFFYVNLFFIWIICFSIFFPDIFFLKNLLIYFGLPIGLMVIFIHSIMLIGKFFWIKVFIFADRWPFLFSQGFLATTFFLFYLIFMITWWENYPRYIFSKKNVINSQNINNNFETSDFLTLKNIDILYESGRILTTSHYYRNSKVYNNYYLFPTRFKNTNKLSPYLFYNNWIGSVYKEWKSELLLDNWDDKFGFIVSDSNDKITSQKVYDKYFKNIISNPVFITLTENPIDLEINWKRNLIIWFILLNLIYWVLPVWIFGKIR